jgi:hypothetical protein
MMIIMLSVPTEPTCAMLVIVACISSFSSTGNVNINDVCSGERSATKNQR